MVGCGSLLGGQAWTEDDGDARLEISLERAGALGFDRFRQTAADTFAQSI